MTILDRYLLREFGKSFLLIVLAFMSLFLIVDFFEKIRMLLSNNASASQMASYFFFRMPFIISQIIPPSVLLSCLVTFNALSRHSEIVAMKANGVSLYRTSIPVMIASVLICCVAFIFNEFITPYSNQKADDVKFIDIQKKQPQGSFKQNQIWYRGNHAIYNFKIFDPDGNQLKGITINYLDNEFHLTMRIDAERAEWQKDRWIFHNLLVTRYGGEFPSLEKIPSQVIDIPEKPSDFIAVQKDSDKMGYLELEKYAKKLKSEGYDATKYMVDLHGKIAFAFVSIILAVIGISFSLIRSARSGGIAISIGAGTAIGFSYWVIYALFISLGHSGTLPPALSAWSANIILSVAAFVSYMRINT
jgi:lipopolysaccharide export system permease protein